MDRANAPARSVTHPRLPEPIRSPTNQTLKYVRSLGRRSNRRRERAFVVEGVRGVRDALASGAVPSHILLREGDPSPIAVEALDPRQTLVRVVAPELFDDLCDTIHPQEILAVFPLPSLPIPTKKAPLFVVVDGLRDPGNLGALIRAAAAAGATALFVAHGTVDPYNPKVVRAAMGAHFRLPIRDLDVAAAQIIRDSTALRAIARVGQHPPPDALDWRQPATLIVTAETGSESEDAAALATVPVSIPMAAGVESLNAAVAGAVILFEAARQRRRGGRRNAIPSGGSG